MEVRQAVPQVAISKIAEVTLCFWIMKVLATTLGETAGDYISMSLGLGYYVGLGITFAILALILVLQITGPTYRPALFWAAIIATTTVGTEISDFLDRSLGLGYAWGSADPSVRAYCIPGDLVRPRGEFAGLPHRSSGR